MPIRRRTEDVEVPAHPFLTHEGSQVLAYLAFVALPRLRICAEKRSPDTVGQRLEGVPQLHGPFLRS